MIFGIILMLIGLSIFLPKLPIFNILFGLLFIYLGIMLFTGESIINFKGIKNKNILAFTNGYLPYKENQGEYIVIFGNMNLDLTNMFYNSNKKIESFTIFGANNISLSKNGNYRITSNTAFGQTDFPSKSTSGFGKSVYISPNFNEKKPFVEIELNTVFGQTIVHFVDNNSK